MELISVQERLALIRAARDLVHLELRDNYGTDRELLAQWLAGELDAVDRAVRAWRDQVGEGIAAGKSYRRARVVSEPLSEYQRFSCAISTPPVDAGEDIRWVPRRLVSTVALPGNDFWLLDDEIVIFNVFDGADDRVERQLYREAAVVKFCRESFTAVWALAIPHHEYQPS